MDLEKAIENQITNIVVKTGKSIEELGALVSASGFQKHAQKLAWVKETLGLGHGDANALVLHLSKKQSAPEPTGDASGDPLGEIYTGAKASLRPIHEAIMNEINAWGHFEVHYKKGYVALRRKKQFAMLGPATNGRVDLGLNAKSLVGSERLQPQAAGGMCHYKVSLTDPGQVDDELFGWLKIAYEASAA
jgi:hypothetical protein